MKIFKWRIFSQARLEKIATIISGVPEDQILARSLLLKGCYPKTGSYPKYRIKVEPDCTYLERKKHLFNKWKAIESSTYHDEIRKKDNIEYHKKRVISDREQLERDSKKPYYINLKNKQQLI